MPTNIKSVKSLGIQKVYDLEIDHPDHSFHVGNIPVHNCSICRSLDSTVYKNMDDLQKKIGQVSQHFNCLCFITVITTAAEPSQRAGVWYTEGERVPTQFKDMTYKEWLKLQPKALQDALNSGRNLSRKQIMELIKL